eukprot:GHVU01041518.1.p3 GENE.GHVU01041518.1~~GHVU01041518.1.p3  ORF type:complete len:151 (+),score=33.70 GHVU01041518.1:515-967(+)
MEEPEDDGRPRKEGDPGAEEEEGTAPREDERREEPKDNGTRLKAEESEGNEEGAAARKNTRTGRTREDTITVPEGDKESSGRGGREWWTWTYPCAGCDGVRSEARGADDDTRHSSSGDCEGRTGRAEDKAETEGREMGNDGMESEAESEV